METNEIIEFKKIRTSGELIGVTFDFIRNNFKKLFLSLLFIAGPFLLIANLGTAYFFRVKPPDPTSILLNMIFTYILLVVYQFVILLVSYSFVSLYIDRGPDAFDVQDVLQHILHNFWKYLSSELIIIPIIIIGLFLCFFPGIYLAIPLSLIFIIRLRENLSIFEAMSRCFELVKDNWWNTFGFLFLIGICQVIIASIFNIPTYIVSFSAGLHQTTDISSLFSTTRVISMFLSTIGYLTYCIQYVGITFQYHNLREQKEATGLFDKLDSIKEDN